MNRRDLGKLKFLCLKEKIWFHTKRLADHNYAIILNEERRTITHTFKTYSLAKEKIDEILYLRRHGLTYDEYLKKSRSKDQR
jgi:hypothetical protein